MTELEEILNSGKIYKVMGQTNEDARYHEYLQFVPLWMMRRFISGMEP